MKIERLEFLRALDAVRPGIEDRGDGGLVHYSAEEKALIARNEDLMAKRLLDLGERSFTTYFAKLHAVLSRMNVKEVVVDVSDDELQIRSKRSRFGLRVLEYFDDPFPFPESYNPVPKDFLKALRFTSISCAKDMTIIPALSCIQVRPDRLSSCDQFRASEWELEEPLTLDDDPHALLPGNAVKEIFKSSEEITGVKFQNKMAHFRISHNTFLSCYTYADDLVDLTPLFDLGEDAVRMEWPEGVLDGMKRAEVFSDPETKTATISIRKNLLKIRSETNEGWYEEKVKMEEPIEAETTFSISAKYLQEVLTYQMPAMITKERVMFEGPNWKHVISTQVSY